MGRKKEYPDIGDRSNGHTLVAMGDDSPDQWMPWLDALVCDYEEVVGFLETLDISIENLDVSDSSYCKMEFSEALGVDYSSSFWEGDHISGSFQMGWIPTREIAKAKKDGASLLKKRKELIRSALIKSIVLNLNHLDIEELVARVNTDPLELKAEVDHLTQAAKRADADRVNLLSSLEQRTNYALAIEVAASECIALSVSLLESHSTSTDPIVAGPLALWQGTIFAICSQGGISAPTSPYTVLLTSLRAANRQVIEVHDKTIVGRSPLSGNIALLKGSQLLSDWQQMWRMKMKHKRILVADTTENSKIAMNLYDVLCKN